MSALKCTICGGDHLPSACKRSSCRVCGETGHWGNECPHAKYYNSHKGTYAVVEGVNIALSESEIALMQGPCTEATGRRIAYQLSRIADSMKTIADSVESRKRPREE